MNGFWEHAEVVKDALLLVSELFHNSNIYQHLFLNFKIKYNILCRRYSSRVSISYTPN
jgi:hypothetical protein